MNERRAFFSLRRLLAGVLAVTLIALPVYFLVLAPNRDRNIAPARLVDTPELAARRLDVGVDEGKLAPDFEISTSDGKRLRLSELRGRPVVMNFWAQWCTSCLSEMPEIKALQAERGVDTVTVLAVNAGETPDEAQEFIDFLEAPFVYGLDTDLTIADAYGVYGLPLSVFIDSEGVIQGVYTGYANRTVLTTLTDAAIAAKPPGPLPTVLRVVTNIERQRTLDVFSLGFTNFGEQRLRIESPGLRCDPSYCATSAVEAGLRIPGLGITALAAGSIELTHSGSLSAEDIAARLVSLLDTLQDPVYLGDFIVRFDPPR